MAVATAQGNMSLNQGMADQWTKDVQALNEKVNEIMDKVAEILQVLSDSDEGGSFGQALVGAIGDYVTKFGKIIEAFGMVIKAVAKGLGEIIDFASNLMGKVKSIAGAYTGKK